MEKPSDARAGKDPKDKRSANAKPPAQKGQQGRKEPSAPRGERPIADVDRKVRGGDA